MKIVSSLVFAVALIASWHFAHANGPQSQSVQVGVQNDLKKIIADYVHQNLPASSDLRFDKFWTEQLKKDKLKATFLYSFEDTSSEEAGKARVEISGTAILNKVDENSETVTYSLDELQIEDNKVEFSEPIQITAGAAAADEPTEPPATETK